MYVHVYTHTHVHCTYRYTHILTGTGMYRCLHTRLCSVHLQVPSHKSARVEVQYAANHLQPSTATLLLVPRGGRGSSGTAMAFTLKGTVTGAKPQVQCTLAIVVHTCTYMYMYIHVPTCIRHDTVATRHCPLIFCFFPLPPLPSSPLLSSPLLSSPLPSSPLLSGCSRGCR